MNTIPHPNASGEASLYSMSSLETFEGLPILPTKSLGGSLGLSPTLQAIANLLNGSANTSILGSAPQDFLVPTPSLPSGARRTQPEASSSSLDNPQAPPVEAGEVNLSTAQLRVALFSPPPAVYAFSTDAGAPVRTYPPTAELSPAFSLADQQFPLQALAFMISDSAPHQPAASEPIPTTQAEAPAPTFSATGLGISADVTSDSIVGLAPSPTVPHAPFPSPVVHSALPVAPGLLASQDQLDHALLVLSTSLVALDARAAALQSSIAVQTMRRAELERELLRAEADKQRARVLRKHEHAATAARTARVRSPSIGAKELGRKKSDARSKAELARRRSSVRRRKASISGKTSAPATPVVPSPAVLQGEGFGRSLQNGLPGAAGEMKSIDSTGSILDADMRIPGLRVVNRGSGSSWMSIAAAEQRETLSRVLSSKLSTSLAAIVASGSAMPGAAMGAGGDHAQMAVSERFSMGSWRGMKFVKMMAVKKKEPGVGERTPAQVE